MKWNALLFAAFLTPSPQLCQPSGPLLDFLQKFQLNNVAAQNLCDEENLYLRLFHAVDFLKGQVVLEENAHRYFEERISTMVVDDPDSSFFCALGGTVAYVHPLEKNTLHICPQSFANDSSTLLTSYVLIHEARHIDGFPHTPCTHGSFAVADRSTLSSGACDTSFEQQGSYGVAAGFLLGLLHSSENAVLRQEARGRLVTDLVQHFNQLPLEAKEGLVAQDIQGQIQFFDGVTKTTLTQLKDYFLQPESVVMSFRADTPVFFAPEGQVKNFLFSSALADTPGLYAKNYRESFSPEERQKLRDVYFADYHDYSCLLFTDELRCGDNYSDAEDLRLPLTAFHPRSFVKAARSQVVEAEELFILSEEGDLYALPKDWSEFIRWSKEVSWVATPFKYGVTSIVEIAGSEFGVDTSQRVVRYSPVVDSWLPADEFAGQNIKKILGPFYWSQKIQDL